MSTPFEPLSSRSVFLPMNDIDTDQIIPARFLKATDQNGMGDHLFANWRYRSDGTPDEAFALNDPKVAGAQILIVGHNFGCGSSREHAPWALRGWGIRVVVATSFADIFRNNALKNGLLPAAIGKADHERLVALRQQDPELVLSVDLAAQAITLPDDSRVTFPIDAFAKHCLLEGTDELGVLLSMDAAIRDYEQAEET